MQVDAAAAALPVSGGSACCIVCFTAADRQHSAGLAYQHAAQSSEQATWRISRARQCEQFLSTSSTHQAYIRTKPHINQLRQHTGCSTPMAPGAHTQLCFSSAVLHFAALLESSRTPSSAVVIHPPASHTICCCSSCYCWAASPPTTKYSHGQTASSSCSFSTGQLQSTPVNPGQYCFS